MKHVTIPLSPGQEAFVDERVAAGRYADAEQVVTALVHAAAKNWAQDKLEALMLEGLESPSAPWKP
ncbi:MAG TPA: hypothetical protein VF592_09455 [Sphingomonas sp.]|uniref:ribbon-helix-helix domain-containing protein n=1 Tax=Sphingomonas sp. TaxID=28214 RepID=UPI002ED83906